MSTYYTAAQQARASYLRGAIEAIDSLTSLALAEEIECSAFYTQLNDKRVELHMELFSLFFHDAP